MRTHTPHPHRSVGYNNTMSNNPRTELDRLISALDQHLTAITNRSGEHDPAIDTAYVEIANAFESYEDALFDEYNEVTPLSVYGDEDDPEEDEEPTDINDNDEDIEYE